MIFELKSHQRKLTMPHANRQETIEHFTDKKPRKEFENNPYRDLQNLYPNHVSYMWRQQS